jgi:hypothetical protein
MIRHPLQVLLHSPYGLVKQKYAIYCSRQKGRRITGGNMRKKKPPLSKSKAAPGKDKGFLKRNQLQLNLSAEPLGFPPTRVVVARLSAGFYTFRGEDALAVGKACGLTVTTRHTRGKAPLYLVGFPACLYELKYKPLLTAQGIVVEMEPKARNSA